MIMEFLGKEDATDKLYGYFKTRKKVINEYLAEIYESETKIECMKVYRE